MCVMCAVSLRCLVDHFEGTGRTIWGAGCYSTARKRTMWWFPGTVGVVRTPFSSVTRVDQERLQTAERDYSVRVVGRMVSGVLTFLALGYREQTPFGYSRVTASSWNTSRYSKWAKNGKGVVGWEGFDVGFLVLCCCMWLRTDDDWKPYSNCQRPEGNIWWFTAACQQFTQQFRTYKNVAMP